MDALHAKIREGGLVSGNAVHIAMDVRADGAKEIYSLGSNRAKAQTPAHVE
ncbi:transposase [Methylocystis parvus]|uniref:transposase n=1 Tax=Methylocystis parvus TaxID=134 RepID=UPI0002F7636E